MSLKQYFTDEDPSIVGSLQTDPLGLRIVWSGLAHNIFRYRVNSITSDLRAYTINLFHYWVVMRVRREMDVSLWSEHFRTKFQQGSHPKFTRSLLVVLEKVFLASICATTNAIDSAGIIGLSNATRRYLQAGKEIPLVFDDVVGEILVRQVQLGFSGRYRTAFVQHLKLVDEETGHPFDNPVAWANAAKKFESIKRFKTLGDLLCLNIKKLLSKKTDEIRHSDITPEIFELYVDCFGSRAWIDKEFAPYWNPILRLDENETRWLWDSFSTSHQSAVTVYLSALDAARKAKCDFDGVEVRGIRQVCEFEPYIARISRIFDSLLSIQFRKIQDVSQWIRNRYGDLPLHEVFPDRADEIAEAISGEGKARVLKLLLLRSHDPEALVQGIIDYHVTVSKYRNARPWIKLTGHLLVRETEFKASPSYDDKLWVHDYHAFQFGSLANSLKSDSIQ